MQRSGAPNKQAAVGIIVGALAFFIVVVAAAGFGIMKVRERIRLNAQLQAELGELKQHVASRAKDGLPPSDEEVDKSLAKFKATAEKLGNEEAAMMRCAAEMITNGSRGSRELRAKLDEVGQLLVAKDMPRPGEIERRLGVLAQFDTLNQRVITQLDAIPTTAERCLETNKVGVVNRKAFMGGVNRSPNARTAQMDLRRIDGEFVTVARKHLEALKSARGHFTYDARRDVLMFERDADLARFQASTREIQAIGERSKRAEEALVALLQQSAAKP